MNRVVLNNAILEIQQLETQLEKCKHQLKTTAKQQFYDHYGIKARKVFSKYHKMLLTCAIVLSRENRKVVGYKPWIELLSYNHSLTHVIPEDKFDKALPSQKELDAYFIIYSCNMRIPERLDAKEYCHESCGYSIPEILLDSSK